MTLCDDAFAPITSVIGFLRAPFQNAVDALEAWRAGIHGSATARSLDGGLVRNIGTLEPLTVGVRPRELLVATRNPAWTAVFDCGHAGGDPVTTVGHLAQEMLVHGVVICSIPPARGADKSTGRYGAIQLELFGPLKTDFMNYVRTISLTQDGSSWRFDANGTVQPFENTEAYGRRKMTDKFTLEMLDHYAGELGLDPFNPDFYPGPSALVAHPAGLLSAHKSMSLTEAQQRLGIEPPAVYPPTFHTGPRP